MKLEYASELTMSPMTNKTSLCSLWHWVSIAMLSWAMYMYTQDAFKEYSKILTTSFYDMNQKIYTKKAYFQNLSWILIFQVMYDCVCFIAPTTMVNSVSSTRLSVKIALISYWNDFSTIPLGKCAS